MTKKQLKLHYIEMYKRGHVTMAKLIEHVPEVDTNPELKRKLLDTIPT